MADAQIVNDENENEKKSKEKSGKDETESKHKVLLKFEEIISLPQSQWLKEITLFNTDYHWKGEKLHLKHWIHVFEKLKEPFNQINELKRKQNEKRNSLINNNNSNNSNNNNNNNSLTNLIENNENTKNLILALLHCFVKLLSHSHRPGITAFKILDVCFVF